ncbi:hypothetical protein [Erythrobacter sp. EC-HK427]|uniref:hypothetical protein n=1 Tax=Erythrobacter sp. EC-HK427 TaxID=2038396 RepID=UPI00125C6589|nr:hypothetical protein [Erythrobacter sp. EC-HK427]VVT00736.1 conserved hypothetical protein [Erythrobacter sp. EC-HK427]
MSETSVGKLIVRHIEELEAALRYSRGPMSQSLGNALADLVDDRRRALDWDGEVNRDLNEGIWFAPSEWRTADNDEESYDLYVEFKETNCLDGKEADTWIGAFCGFAGAGVRLRLNTNALGPRDWKALLRTETKVIDQLVEGGFLCDPKKGELAALISIEKDKLAEAFAVDEFDEALQPFGWAIDRIANKRSSFDELVAAIRRVR